MNIKLSPRLQLAASAVRVGKKIADIGTDHAYLPVRLILSGKTPSAIAADLRKGPLENAQKTAEKYGLEDKITLRLSDGLDKILPDEADDIIMAGMGGILISEIIEKNRWLQDKSKRLVLQPMTHIENVRKCLLKNGFEIINESAAVEGKRTYVCINAAYTGEKTVKEPYYDYIGELFPPKNPAALNMIKSVLKRLKKRSGALILTSKPEDKAEAETLKAAAEKIEELLKASGGI